MKKKLINLTTGLVLVGMVEMASAIPITTTIIARITGITGNQLPTHLFANDLVTFIYSYDNESTTAHNYDFNSYEVSTRNISYYPHMSTFLSDADVIYSANLLEAFSEYNGSHACPVISRTTSIGCDCPSSENETCLV